MAERRTRAFRTDLEIRTAGDGRTVVGVAAPINVPTEIREYGGSFTEVIRPGAFTRTISERGPGRIKVLAQHDSSGLPIGKAVALREDGTGLHAELRISDTERGNDVLELIRDGVMSGLSIGFEAIDERTARDGTRELLEIRLHEISIVSAPAYEDALVTGVRSVDLSFPALELARRRLALRERELT